MGRLLGIAAGVLCALGLAVSATAQEYDYETVLDDMEGGAHAVLDFIPVPPTTPADIQRAKAWNSVLKTIDKARAKFSPVGVGSALVKANKTLEKGTPALEAALFGDNLAIGVGYAFSDEYNRVQTLVDILPFDEAGRAPYQEALDDLYAALNAVPTTPHAAFFANHLAQLKKLAAVEKRARSALARDAGKGFTGSVRETRKGSHEVFDLQDKNATATLYTNSITGKVTMVRITTVTTLDDGAVAHLQMDFSGEGAEMNAGVHSSADGDWGDFDLYLGDDPILHVDPTSGVLALYAVDAVAGTVSGRFEFSTSGYAFAGGFSIKGATVTSID